MLDRQYNLYSVDTGHFFSNRELHLHNRKCTYRREQNDIHLRLTETKQKLKECGYLKEDIKNLKNGNTEKIDMIDGSYDTIAEYLLREVLSSVFVKLFSIRI